MSPQELVQAVIVAPEGGFAARLGEAVGVAPTRVAPERLGPSGESVALDSDAHRVVWIHPVPASPRVSGDENTLVEAELLVHSAAAARAAAAAADVQLTFLCLLPSRGLLEGAAGRAAELARGAFQGLANAEVAEWGAAGHRLVAVVHGGLEDFALEGQRPPEEVLRRTPIGRLGALEELADAIRYLGSSSAAYVTGAVLHVDGGWNAYSWIYPARTT